jgi:hypothetical protein
MPEQPVSQQQTVAPPPHLMDGRQAAPGLEYVAIATATPEHPRNDSALMKGAMLDIAWLYGAERIN